MRIKISLSFWFTALITALLLMDKTGLMPLVFASFIVHEAGHIILLGRFKNVKAIEFNPSGVAIVRDNRASNDYTKDILVSLAGPLANLLVAIILLPVYIKCEYQYVLMAILINCAIAFFNLLPMATLDGRQIFYRLICLYWGEDVAYKVTGVVSLITLIICAVAGTWLFARVRSNPTLLITSVYMLIMEIVDIKQGMCQVNVGKYFIHTKKQN